MQPFFKTSFFAFSRRERYGLLILVLLIAAFQAACFYADAWLPRAAEIPDKAWLALDARIDSLKAQRPEKTYKRYPFNPNFISDFKGYQLGMTVTEIDKLHAFRKQGRFVNSAREFQDVTGVSDSLLAALSPYFKFPDWVHKRNEKREFASTYKRKPLPMRDINTATKQDLMAVYGIGEVLSDKILTEREKLGGFVSMEQLGEIWGIRPETLAETAKSFSVIKQPEVRKIKVNDASIKELMALPYFKYPLAKAIVTYRSMNGKIQNVEDLSKISGFPVDKKNFIALYLDF